MKSLILLISLFSVSSSFAGTVKCFTKEAPHEGRTQNQFPTADYTAAQGYIDIKGIADPQIEYIALGDDRGVEIFVKDLRTGIAADNDGPPTGAGVTLNMGKSGEYSLYCQTAGAFPWGPNPTAATSAAPASK